MYACLTNGFQLFCRTAVGFTASVDQLANLLRRHWLFHSSRLYISAVLAGIPGNLLNGLQSVLNATAFLVHDARQYDHITSLLLCVVCEYNEACCISAGRACLSVSAQGTSYLTADLNRVADVKYRVTFIDLCRRRHRLLHIQLIRRSAIKHFHCCSSANLQFASIVCDVIAIAI